MNLKRRTSVWVLVVAGAGITVPAQAQLTNNLIGYWSFNGTNADWSGFGRDLTYSGGLGYTTGRTCQGLNIPDDPNKYAYRPVNDTAFDFGASEFTVHLWVWFNDTSGEQVMIEKLQGMGSLGWTVTKLADQRLLLHAAPWGQICASSPISITTNTWHHVAVRRGGPDRSIGIFTICYDDSVVAVSGNVGGTPVSPAPDTLLIGRRNGADPRDFSMKGRIDEVAIWTRGLSTAEIAQLWNGGAGSPVVPDCNGNCVSDSLDIAYGSSADDNVNGVPDECEATILYVDASTWGDGYGTSWLDAFVHLQQALRVTSNPGNAVEQIWVAEGTYMADGGYIAPGYSYAHVAISQYSEGDRAATFSLVNGVAIYGGFRQHGGNGTFEGRDPDTYETILSGDVGTLNDNADNSYHVVWAGNTITDTAETVIDGFTISGGNADGSSPHYYGGGLYCFEGSPTIRNCTVFANRANYGGSGIRLLRCAPKIRNCRIAANMAGTSAYGGGIHCYDSDPIIANCVISQNWLTGAYSSGGGIYCYDSNPTIVNCKIEGNSAGGQQSYGGGVSCISGSLSVTNCAFTGNTTGGSGFGGAVYCYDSFSSFTNCAFSGNVAGVYGGGVYSWGSLASIANCILWDDWASAGPEIAAESFSTLTIAYGSVQGGQAAVYVGGSVNLGWDLGNIAADPLFVRVPSHGGDGWGDDPATPGIDEGLNDDYGDLRLRPGSPCIDAGDNTAVPADTSDLDDDGDLSERLPLDLGRQGRFIDDLETQDTGIGPSPIVDMGAYDRHPEIIHVSSAGNDANDGLTWQTAKLTVAGGLDAAVAGDQIWVAEGIYLERVTLKDGVALYGGFAGMETQLGQRNWAANVTILDSSQTGCVVYSPPGVTASTRMDGFTVRNGFSPDGGGIRCDDSSPVIANNRITGSLTLWTEFGNGGGILCYNGSPTIADNTITANIAASGGGICCYGGSPMIRNNTITGNSARNLGGGIFCSGGSPTIANNAITGNTADGTYGYRYGGGIYCDSNSLVINNTITANSASYGGGIYCAYASSPTITNTVVAFNSSGIWEESGYGTPTLLYNCVYGNTAYDYSGIADPTGTNGNISIDPLVTPDGHLQAGSPCIDAGSNADVPPDLTADRDGELRFVDDPAVRDTGVGTPPIVDIGADEYADADGDRLPDWWEASYPDAAQPAGDSDQDDLGNLEEYEVYSSNPVAQPVYVAVGASPGGDGTPGLPFDTIQAGIDAAEDGNTILVAPGTYSGPGNTELDYRGKAVIVRSSAGPAQTTIDCGGNGRAVSYMTSAGAFAVLEGFTITNGSVSDFGGGVGLELSRFMLRNCIVTGNAAGVGQGGKGGGVYSSTGMPSFYDVLLESNSADAGNNGWLSQSNVQIPQGTLTLGDGELQLRSSQVHGAGEMQLASGSLLRIAGDPSSPPTVIRTDVRGTGDIEIAAGQQLTLAGSAVLNLSGFPDEVCNPLDEPGAPSGGQVTVDGAFLVQDHARVHNTRVAVKIMQSEGDGDIVHNDISLLEASTGYGGQFFVAGSATISCNRIFSEGDRYLDLDPDPGPGIPHPTITNNQIHVLIKEGQLSEKGTLLELRSQDFDAGTPGGANPEGKSGAWPAPDSEGFTEDPSANWVLEELEIEGSATQQRGAKLNLTNRPGFEFHEPDVAETVYVKKLKLHPYAVLNTALQTLYCQQLVLADGSGDETVWSAPPPFPAEFPNGARIVDEPLLGFSLGIIAMGDDVEFDVRVRSRPRDPSDDQPTQPPYMEGRIERADDPGSGGVMDMRTQAPGSLAASSVAAKGSFARAGDEDIVITFEYRFFEVTAGTKLNVYLSDKPKEGQRIFKVAELRPPPAGRPGSVGDDRFGLFQGRFPRDVPGVYELNFVRGTYVELELVANEDSPGHRIPASTRVWIDNFDPRVYCQTLCATFDSDSALTPVDLLVLLAETGQAVPFGKWCLDLNDDGYLNLGDLATWEMIANTSFAFCPLRKLGACCLPGGGCAEETQGACLTAGGTYKGDNTSCASVSCGPAPAPSKSAASRSFSPVRRLDALSTDTLAVLGKPDETAQQDDRIYTLTTHGTCRTDGQPVPIPCEPGTPGCDRTRGAVRLIRDADGTVYVVHSIHGVLNADTGQPIVTPSTLIRPDGKTVSVGVNAAAGSGIPLSDAAFRPDGTEPGYIYVVPVQVTVDASESIPQHTYKAAAKLELSSGGSFTVAALYGLDPMDPAVQSVPGNACLNCTPVIPGGTCRPSCDFSGMREIEVDSAGNVYLAAAAEYNQNDWIQIFNTSGNELGRVELNAAFATTGYPAPRGPSALLISANDPTKLYLTSSVDTRNLITRLYRFTITGGSLGWDGAVEVEQPMPEARSGTTCDGFASAITSIQEAPDGRLLVVGYSAPTFEKDEALPASVNRIFTTPTLAEVPSGTSWATNPSSVPKIDAEPIEGCRCNLALPVSALFIPASGAPVQDADDDGVADGQDVCPGTLPCVVVDATGCPAVACGQIADFTAAFVGGSQIQVNVSSTLPGGTELHIRSDDGRRELMILNGQGAGQVFFERLKPVHTVSIAECPGRSVVVGSESDPPCWAITALEVRCDESDPGHPKVVATVQSSLAKDTPLTLEDNGQPKAATVDCRGEARAVFDGLTGGQTVRILQCPSYIATLACPSMAPGDFNFDGYVDQDDVELFEACASGPGIPRPSGCENKDLDHDNDVDQADFSILQRCFSGENVPADPNCAN